uniref:Uncharacterized protein n=1 Tax=Ixodes ricinus TaxID=34613 RepID=A0A6B0U7N0_IXORI
MSRRRGALVDVYTASPSLAQPVSFPAAAAKTSMGVFADVGTQVAAPGGAFVDIFACTVDWSKSYCTFRRDAIRVLASGR